MEESPISQLIKYGRQAEELALLLIEQVATMTVDELEKNSEKHLRLQNHIIELTEEIKDKTVSREETYQLDEAHEILARLIEHNKKITAAARNSQALLKNNMRCMGESRVALTGYSQSQISGKKAGRLINSSR
ncbi:hypothetical protein [Desulfotalea psychrophila]|uniref:Flagellar protein FlgN n=1 Tax=Desulfotalea psychrophila (strain LSv54 / DSM 12343) TaxID=177439 RepID=Q6AMN9_DESPS|nr:hypothetical protein [Desulfotalea psychrophila]CAG36386.1 unknown protein [Desulfotalea psychrophila LSv54]